MSDLEDACIFHQRLESCERLLLVNLIGCNASGEQAVLAAIAALPVGKRHIARFIRIERKREAAQYRLHGIETRGGDVECHKPELFCPGDPGIEPVEGAHDFVTGAIKLRMPCRFRAGSGKRPGRELNLAAGWYRRALGFPFRKVSGAVDRGGAWRLGRCPGSCAELAVGLDLCRIDAGKLRDAAGQRDEFHRLEEGDQAFVVRLMHREIGKRHIEGHVIIQSDKLFR